MTKILEMFTQEAREELIRDGLIELVTVTVHAVPDPARPGDTTAMIVTAEVYSEFRAGVPAIDAGLAALGKACRAAAADLSPASAQYLLRALGERRRETDAIRKSMGCGVPVAPRSGPDPVTLIGPEDLDLDPKVLVWCHTWSAGMEDSGLICMDRDDPLIADGIDGASRARIRERIHTRDAGIAAIVNPLLREG
jgi:hypothetical protein